ncbi:MAG: hypothetical protein BM564_03295 [Bacteroidetes bacterium MedPE-SWsnd-G2]|nr:MAG: hypothetical protein BM564_03295 [Bacteroidetes bacterium MedPE-SWsnd-G2]
MGISRAQDEQTVDFLSLQADISIDPFKKKVSGKTKFKLNVLSKSDSVVIDGRFMKVSQGLVNSKKANIFSNDQFIWIKHKFKGGKTYTIEFNYEVFPKKCMYFVGWETMNNPQVWTQGQGKYTSNWLPSFDDTNEKLEFDLSVTFLKGYEIIANGEKIESQVVNDKMIKVTYNMEKPMSSYLVALAIGKYESYEEVSNLGIPLLFYHYSSDALKTEPSFRYSKQMFDFLESEIGVSYPWQNYKQVPVHDFLYSGMENTGTTIFSDRFMVDSVEFGDKNYVNVNAHELAHQWFGDLVTAKSGEHHWLQEGFATYYALLAEKEVFGDAYYNNVLVTYANNLLEQDKTGGSTKLLNPKSSSITFYQKGCWLLHRLRQVVGDAVFRTSVKRFLDTYQYRNAESFQFIAIVEEESGEDLTAFFDLWLNTVYFPENALRLGITNQDVQAALDLTEENIGSKTSSDYNEAGFYSKKKMISLSSKMNDSVKKEIFSLAMDSNTIKLRQEVAKQLEGPLDLEKERLESLLRDASYVTNEIALYKLWQWFPDNRMSYLDETKDIIGSSALNFRTLWLALSLATENYDRDKAMANYQELVKYTGLDYSFEIRKNAMEYLVMLDACNTTCSENIKKASKHHNWRFKKFAEQLLKEIEN